MELSKCVCIDDFQQHALQTMQESKFYYIQSGAQDQLTKQMNKKYFHKLMIIPKVLKSSSYPKMNCQILSYKCQLPFGFAPTAMNQLANKQGQKIPAKIAKQYQIAYCLSLLSNTSFSDIKLHNESSLRIMQMYVSTNWQTTLKTIKLAEYYGFHALAITVDAQILGVRHKQSIYKFDSSSYKFPILQQINHNSSNMGNQRRSYLKNRDLSMTWATIQKIRSHTKLKIILKGILHHQDAKIATKYCDAIWVSNHGGRQLDNVPCPIEVLQKIRMEVGKQFEVYVDGGVRTGNDVFKCIALGANYVFIGRPISYALTLGYEGVKKMVEIFKDQFKRAMILTGCNQIQDIKSNLIKHQPNL